MEPSGFGRIHDWTMKPMNSCVRIWNLDELKVVLSKSNHPFLWTLLFFWYHQSFSNQINLQSPVSLMGSMRIKWIGWHQMVHPCVKEDWCHFSWPSNHNSEPSNHNSETLKVKVKLVCVWYNPTDPTEHTMHVSEFRIQSTCKAFLLLAALSF